MVSVPKIQQALSKPRRRRKRSLWRRLALLGVVVGCTVFTYSLLTQTHFLSGPERELRIRLNESCPKDTNCVCYSAFLLAKMDAGEIDYYLQHHSFAETTLPKETASKNQCFSAGYSPARNR